MGSIDILVTRKPKYYGDLFTVYYLMLLRSVLYHSGNVLVFIHRLALLVEILIYS